MRLITYRCKGKVGSDDYEAEVRFRTDLLGKGHWSAISISGENRTITVKADAEQAILFALKFPECYLTGGNKDLII